MKVLLATCAELPTGDGDDDALIGALADVGVHAEWARWDTVDGSGADLVVLRATWDYPERPAEFLSWCDTVPNLANPAPVVRWNLDKVYLAALLAAGVPVVPTTVVSPGERPVWPSGEFVVKPTVGVGSRGVLRVAPGDFAAAETHVAALGVPVLVQPYQRAVDAHGETAVVFLGGRYSHAFTKGAMLALGGAENRTAVDAELDPSGHFVVERLTSARPDAARRRVAEDVMDAAAEQLGVRRADLLYARVDLVAGEDGSPVLMELELAEPSLGFRQTDESAPWRFASAVRAALSP